MSLFCTGVYEIWRVRNEVRHGELPEAAVSVARRTVHLAKEWQCLHPTLEKVSRSLSEQRKKPSHDRVKANVDGALNKGDGSGGCGVVLRNHEGLFLEASSVWVKGVSDPFHSELMACRRALERSWQPN